MVGKMRISSSIAMPLMPREGKEEPKIGVSTQPPLPHYDGLMFGNHRSRPIARTDARSISEASRAVRQFAMTGSLLERVAGIGQECEAPRFCRTEDRRNDDVPNGNEDNRNEC
jgi:hypothetical protein